MNDHSPMAGYRIGNIIKIPNIDPVGRHTKGEKIPKLPYGMVSEIDMDGLVVIDPGFTKYVVKEPLPVEITFTILEQCGFTKGDKGYTKSLPNTVGLQLYYAHNNSPSMLCLLKDGQKEMIHLKHVLGSLHELMNIFYSFTKEELVWSEFNISLEELVYKSSPSIK